MEANGSFKKANVLISPCPENEADLARTATGTLTGVKAAGLVIIRFAMNCTILGDPCGHRPWYEFHECAEAPYAFVFYFAVKVFNLVVGTPCNVLVMWQIVTKKSDASTSDIFIFNLALLDAYFCLMTPIELLNRVQMDDSRIWYFARFAYGIKDVAPLFLVRAAASRVFYLQAVCI